MAETPRNGEEGQEVTFQIMPMDSMGHARPMARENAPESAPVQREELPGEQPQEHLPVEDEDHPFNNKIAYIAMAVLIVGALGALGYFLLNKTSNNGPAQQQATSRLPSTWLKQYFDVESCVDVSVCGDEADPDNDGLVNYDEYRVRRQSDPKNPDSDSDGLADGDEVHIYKTDPNAKFSSCKNDGTIACQYDDGSQIANDYDPLLPGKKMDEARKAQIAADTEAKKLHEPTNTTLQSKKAAASSSSSSSTQEHQTYSVSINANGEFSPSSLTVNVGDNVVWLNRSDKQHQIASDPHPTHDGLAGLESPVLTTNQTFTFTFNKEGTFGYHDHLNPTLKGTVTVK